MLQLLDNLTFGNPWRELDRLHRDLNRMFTRETPVNHAPVNVYTSDDTVKVVIAVPGWEPEWFDISVEGDKLNLRGEKEIKEGDNTKHLTLDRIVTLPYRVESDNVEATYRNGILTLDLHRSELDKPKKIAIQTA